MNQSELKKVLSAHALWLKGDVAKGARANLRGANLRGANLRDTDLRCADLRGADLRGADLRYANLYRADLRDTDLRGAQVRDTDLRCADLRGADLRYANLRDTNLRDTNIDFSAWPLWCGSLSPKIDKRIAAQLLYHALRAMQSCADDPDVAAVLSSRPCLKLANHFHRANECGKIEPPKGGDK